MTSASAASSRPLCVSDTRASVMLPMYRTSIHRQHDSLGVLQAEALQRRADHPRHQRAACRQVDRRHKPDDAGELGDLGCSGEEDLLDQFEARSPAFWFARVVEARVDYVGGNRPNALRPPNGPGGVEIERNLAAGKVI